MRTNKTAIQSEKRLVATKEQNKPFILKSKTELCTKCHFTPISPFEVELCDFCADELRYTPRTM